MATRILVLGAVQRGVRTDAGEYEAEVLVVALGRDCDLEATPRLEEAGSEFYSVAGAERVREVLPDFSEGRAVIGVREHCENTFLMPLPSPMPPSPETSEAFAERNIEFVPDARIASLDKDRNVAVLKDGREFVFDIFLRVPKHRAPDVVLESGMAEEGYVPVESSTLRTRFPGVYAVGDVATTGVPNAGVFAEGAARVVAAEILAEIRGGEEPAGYDGRGSCYVEFGGGRVGRVDVDFLSGPKPTGRFQAPSSALVTEKRNFGSSRHARWLGS